MHGKTAHSMFWLSVTSLCLVNQFLTKEMEIESAQQVVNSTQSFPFLHCSKKALPFYF